MSSDNARVREAIHQADVDLTGRPGPFILTACIGADGAVWAVLTDAAGGVVKTRQIKPWDVKPWDGPQ